MNQQIIKCVKILDNKSFEIEVDGDIKIIAPQLRGVIVKALHPTRLRNKVLCPVYRTLLISTAESKAANICHSLDLPLSSFKNFHFYCKWLHLENLVMSGVTTVIYFDPVITYPCLKFRIGSREVSSVRKN